MTDYRAAAEKSYDNADDDIATALALLAIHDLLDERLPKPCGEDVGDDKPCPCTRRDGHDGEHRCDCDDSQTWARGANPAYRPVDVTVEPPCGSQVTDTDGDVWQRFEYGWEWWMPLLNGRRGWSDLGDYTWSELRPQVAPLHLTTDADRERVGLPVATAPDVDPDEALAQVRADNLDALKHEAETPMRGHGDCCDDPDEALAKVLESAEEYTATWPGMARLVREHIEAERSEWDEWYKSGWEAAIERAEKAEADVERLTRERDGWMDVAKGAGSRANSEATRRGAADARHKALRADVQARLDEWHETFMALPDATKKHADVLSDCVDGLSDTLDRDDERRQS